MEMTCKQADNILPSILYNLHPVKRLLNEVVCVNENVFLCQMSMGFCF